MATPTDTKKGRTDLESSLLAAFAFFGLFGQPLTPLEAAKFRYRHQGAADTTDKPNAEIASSRQRASAPLPGRDHEPALAEIISLMRSLPLCEEDGCFWLEEANDRSGSPARLRHQRFRLGENHFKRARAFARWASRLPSVRLIAVCNSLAVVGADEGSDIDVFVVCRPGTLWVTRLIVVGALRVLGLRPTPENQAGKLCLSFFLSEANLDLARFFLGPDDVYFHYWLATLVPVYDAGGVYAGLLAANPWLAERMPGFRPMASGHRLGSSPPRLKLPLAVLLGLEPLAARFQRRLLPAAIRNLRNRDTRVVIADDVLKFHVNDRRAEYRDRFLGRIRVLANSSGKADASATV